MQNHTEPSTPRREFLGQIAVSALALAGSACAGSAASPQTAATPAAAPAPRPQTHWDDSWSARLTAKHKAVFDMPDIQDPAAIYHAAVWLEGVNAALGAAPGEARAVIVIRHAAVPAAYNDAIWSKYEIGKLRKVKDDATGKWAVRNPFASPAPAKAGDPPARSSGADRPGDTLDWFAEHGHTLLACNLATLGMATIIADKVKGKQEAIYEELKANLLPGVILQPSGIYAVHRAQEAGCTFSS